MLQTSQLVSQAQATVKAVIFSAHGAREDGDVCTSGEADSCPFYADHREDAKSEPEFFAVRPMLELHRQTKAGWLVVVLNTCNGGNLTAIVVAFHLLV